MVFLPTGLASRIIPFAFNVSRFGQRVALAGGYDHFIPWRYYPCNLSSAIFLSDFQPARWFLRVRWLWESIRGSGFGFKGPPAQDQTQPQPDQGQAQPQKSEAKIFTGTVLKSGSQYVLRDSSGQVYKLDDSESAKPYEGKAVKVTGKLDEQAMLIHVQSIEGSEA